MAHLVECYMRGMELEGHGREQVEVRLVLHEMESAETVVVENTVPEMNYLGYFDAVEVYSVVEGAFVEVAAVLAEVLSKDHSGNKGEVPHPRNPRIRRDCGADSVVADDSPCYFVVNVKAGLSTRRLTRSLYQMLSKTDFPEFGEFRFCKESRAKPYSSTNHFSFLHQSSSQGQNGIQITAGITA